MAAKEYNADIDILAPSEENDVERQNELLKEAIDRKPDADPFFSVQFHGVKWSSERSERRWNPDQFY